jgi:hypothetical protein
MGRGWFSPGASSFVRSEASVNPANLRTHGHYNDSRWFRPLFLLDLFVCLTRQTDEPVSSPVEVTVNGVTVTVTLMLKPGSTVTLEQKPEPPKSVTPSDA